MVQTRFDHITDHNQFSFFLDLLKFRPSCLFSRRSISLFKSVKIFAIFTRYLFVFGAIFFTWKWKDRLVLRTYLVSYILLYFFTAYNSHRSCSGAKLLSSLNKCIRSGRWCAISSDEKNNLLSGVTAVSDAFVCFHINFSYCSQSYLLAKSVHEVKLPNSEISKAKISSNGWCGSLKLSRFPSM